MLSENSFMLQVLAHPYYSTIIRDFIGKLLLSATDRSIPEYADIREDNWQALAMLCNSVLNNYVLTQDEKSCAEQLNFIIECLGLK